MPNVDDARSQLQPYLRPGEQLLWWGRPDPAVVFTPADAVLIPFTIMWAGFSVFWEAAVIASGGPWFFALWGVPFICVGLYLVFGKFIVKRRRKERTVYGITTARVLVTVGAASLVDSPIQYTPVTVKRARDGRHVSAIIGNANGPMWYASAYGNTGLDAFTRYAGTPTAFYDVADGDNMLHALDRARGLTGGGGTE
jgi:hypothetical protein